MITALLLLPALQTLVIGGGPEPQYNQVAIESNVRYMGKIVHPNDPFRVLFADGTLTAKTVQFRGEKPVGETKIGPFTVPGSVIQYREPHIPRQDGAAILENVRKEIVALGRDPKAPAFIYFTGHGSIAPDLKVSEFDLWSQQRFAVPDLVDSIRDYASDKPVTILMVQCHSSDFANVIYQDANPGLGLAKNRVCGFFASISARPAAGCTPALQEEYYKDFSSYFLAALTGRDRVDRKVEGADFDHNGLVGMNEAFCWSLINDDSIDTPVCTSDVLLKTTAQMPDSDVFRTRYADVLKWANPAQKAALEGLSSRLELDGENRLSVAYEKYARITEQEERPLPVLGYRFVCLARSVVLGEAMRKSGDKALRARFETLVKDEAQNPFSASR
ncbi:MAG: hypothetical protein JST12_15670 [Armatimonadetes bacterium]|nr:hypothetical protein [Armatimonadota bacterium]